MVARVGGSEDIVGAHLEGFTRRPGFVVAVFSNGGKSSCDKACLN